MNGTDLGDGSVTRKTIDNRLHRFPAKSRHILEESYGQIGLPVGLVRGKGAAGYRAQDFCTDRFQALAVCRTFLLRLPVAALHDFSFLVIAEIEGTVFAHYPRNRPLPGD